MSSAEPSYCIRANLPLASEASVAKANVRSIPPNRWHQQLMRKNLCIGSQSLDQFSFSSGFLLGENSGEQLWNSSASSLRVSRFQVNLRKQQRLNCEFSSHRCLERLCLAIAEKVRKSCLGWKEMSSWVVNYLTIVQQVFPEFFLCGRHWSKFWGHSHDQDQSRRHQPLFPTVTSHHSAASGLSCVSVCSTKLSSALIKTHPHFLLFQITKYLKVLVPCPQIEREMTLSP